MNRKSIWYAGTEVFFNREIDDIDESQALLDHFRNKGKEACCLHKNGKHQLYVEGSNNE